MKYLSPIVFVIILFFGIKLTAQNVAITDDNGYTADPSAMLDVKSTNKGMLIPRLTTAQRQSIASPANGLMVFDTNEDSFYFYSGSSWISLSNTGDIWTKNGNTIFTTDTVDKVGIGTTLPIGKLEVKADGNMGISEPIFEVINANGDTVFAVYNEGVRINVSEDPIQSKVSGNRGGFAVGGFSQAKTASEREYLRVTPDSVRIYFDDMAAPVSGNRGGFAVGGFSQAKGVRNDYLFVQDDSTRVYVVGNEGFAIDNIADTTTKGRYMDMDPDNYFIGHRSGDTITSGKYNSFFGFETGLKSTSANSNVFVGYQAGISNTTADNNNFIGYQAGYYNTSGIRNNFIGYQSGYDNDIGDYNNFMGYRSGYNNTSGNQNNFIGYQAGYFNTTGSNNNFMGYQAGYYNNVGAQNTFVGNRAGRANTFGNYNSLYGHYAGYSAVLKDNNLIMGYYSGFNADSSSNAVILGSFSGYNNQGENNIFIGYEAGYTNSTAVNNTFLGTQSGYSNTSGSKNVYIGYQAGNGATTGYSNVFIGDDAGSSANGGENVIIGKSAGQNNTAAMNVFVGAKAGRDNTTGQYNCYIGHTAGIYGSTGSGNLNIGWGSGANNNGSDNTILGYWGGFNISNSNYNIFIGPYCGFSREGNDNIIIGRFSGTNAGSNSIFIGNNLAPGGSNNLFIESMDDEAYPLIYGEFDNNFLRVNGNMHIYNNVNAVSQKGLVIDTDGESTDIPLRIRTVADPSTTSFTDADTKFVVYGDGDTEITGSIMVGGGTAINMIQEGRATIGTNTTGGVKTITINFASTFPGAVPNVNVTVRGGNFNDVYAVTTRSVTTTTFQVNVYRVDSPGGMWGQTLYLDWWAWN